MRNSISLSEVKIGSEFNRGEICASKYILLEKESKTFNDKKYDKIQHIGITFTGIDFQDAEENIISFIPSDSIVYLKN